MAVAEPAQPTPADIGARLFADMHERFIGPEVEARRAAGTFGDDDRVWRYQVLLPPEGVVEVRLNEEVGGDLLVRAVSEEVAASKGVGDEVVLADVAGVERYEPRPEDAGVPHVTAFAHSQGWSVAFDFTWRHPRRLDYLAHGQAFAETAREARRARRVGVALDNAYSAAELLAKAELLSYRPTIDEALAARSHGAVATPYALWARLDNTDMRFVQLLHRLAELRGAGRYLNRDLDADEAEVERLMALLTEMEAHVRAVAEGDAADAPRGFNVIAARDTRAGEVVGRGDYTIRRPKRPRPDGATGR